ncbi:MAG: hypothetical protein ABFD79_06480 [Phycisphaerales bacterium]
MTKKENKQIRTGLKTNPEGYNCITKLFQLQRKVLCNTDFAKYMNEIFESIRKARQMTDKLSSPVKGMMEEILNEYNAQLKLIYEEAHKKQSDDLSELLEEINAATIKADEEWSKTFDCQRPKTPEEWQTLAARAGLSADFVLKGQWMPEDILPVLEGYLQRLKDQKPQSHILQIKSNSRSKLKGVPKRSWTSAELEKAIRDYIAKRGSDLSELTSIQESKLTSRHQKTLARCNGMKIFGRNAIARALGVKSPRMVGETSAWRSVAAILKLHHKVDDLTRKQSIEENCNESDEVSLPRSAIKISGEPVISTPSPEDDLIQEERKKTIAYIRKLRDSVLEDAKERADSLLDDYKKGAITDTNVRLIIDSLFND